MSKRAELKENILASKLELFLAWGLKNKNTVFTILGIVVAAALIASVFILRIREKRETNYTRLAQAQYLINQHNYSEATRILSDLKSSSSDPAFISLASYYNGLAALGSRDFESAAASFQATVDQTNSASPLRPLALSNLGYSLEQKKDYEGAANVYGRFMTDYGDHFMAPRIQLALGRALGLAGKPEESKKALEQLIDLYPTSVWAENARTFMDKNKTR